MGRKVIHTQAPPHETGIVVVTTRSVIDQLQEVTIAVPKPSEFSFVMLNGTRVVYPFSGALYLAKNKSLKNVKYHPGSTAYSTPRAAR